MITERFLPKLILALVFLWALSGHAQTACSTTNPCVQVSVTTTVAANVGAATATLLVCGGGPTSCNTTNLAAFLASPTSPSPWSVLGVFTQKALTVDYNDPEPYGALRNYAAYNTPTGGSAGPVSGIITFQVPAAAQTPPSLTAGPTIVTSGTAGPQ